MFLIVRHCTGGSQVSDVSRPAGRFRREHVNLAFVRFHQDVELIGAAALPVVSAITSCGASVPVCPVR
jgi:hypothetical protein